MTRQPSTPRSGVRADDTDASKADGRERKKSYPVNLPTPPLGTVHHDTEPLVRLPPATDEVAIESVSQPTADDSDESFDPWRFGAVEVPPDAIHEYMQQMERLRAGVDPAPQASLRAATTQASLVRQAQSKRRWFITSFLCGLVVLALGVSILNRKPGEAPRAPGAESARTNVPRAREAEPMPVAPRAETEPRSVEARPSPDPSVRPNPVLVPKVDRRISSDASNSTRVRTDPAPSASSLSVPPPRTDDIFDTPFTRRPRSRSSPP